LVASKWELVWTPNFTALYQSKDEKLQRQTKELIEVLAQSPNPLHYGEKLHNLGFYAARISKGDRLAYCIEGRQLKLLKVCDHKQVLGKD